MSSSSRAAWMMSWVRVLSRVSLLRSRPCSLAWVMRFWASWCSVVMVLFSPVGVGRVYTVFLTVPDDHFFKVVND